MYIYVFTCTYVYKYKNVYVYRYIDMHRDAMLTELELAQYIPNFEVYIYIDIDIDRVRVNPIDRYIYTFVCRG